MTQPARLEHALRPHDLLGEHGLVAQAGHLVPDRPRRGNRRRRRHIGVDDENAQIRRRVVVRAHRRRQLTLADRPIQTRRAARAEHAGGEVEHGGVLVHGGLRPPPEHELGLRDVAGELAIAEPIAGSVSSGPGCRSTGAASRPPYSRRT